MKNLPYFLGIFVLLTNAGDLFTTLIGLSLGAVELNPLMAQIGVTPFFLKKIFFPTIAVIIALVVVERADKVKNRRNIIGVNVFLGLVGCTFLYALINNLFMLSQLI